MDATLNEMRVSNRISIGLNVLQTLFIGCCVAYLITSIKPSDVYIEVGRQTELLNEQIKALEVKVQAHTNAAESRDQWIEQATKVLADVAADAKVRDGLIQDMNTRIDKILQQCESRALPTS